MLVQRLEPSQVVVVALDRSLCPDRHHKGLRTEPVSHSQSSLTFIPKHGEQSHRNGLFQRQVPYQEEPIQVVCKCRRPSIRRSPRQCITVIQCDHEAHWDSILDANRSGATNRTGHSLVLHMGPAAVGRSLDSIGHRVEAGKGPDHRFEQAVHRIITDVGDRSPGSTYHNQQFADPKITQLGRQQKHNRYHMSIFDHIRRFEFAFLALPSSLAW